MHEILTLPELQAEVQRRIGRNVINFQKLEALLKASIASNHVWAPLNAIQPMLERKQKMISAKTLGELTGRHIESFYSPESQCPSRPESFSGDIGISFRIPLDSAALAARKAALADLVARRNRLIHQLLPAYDDSSPENCRRLLADLDSQHELLATEIETARQIYSTMIEARRECLSVLLEQLQERGE